MPTTRSPLPLLLALTVAFSTITVLVSANAWVQVPVGDLPFSVQFVEAGYRINTDTTIFTYTITAGAQALGHFQLIPSCNNPPNILAFQPWQYGYTDVNSHLTGYKYLLGLAPGQSETISLILQGKVKVNIVGGQFALYGSGVFGVGNIPVPDCTGLDLLGICPAPEDTSIACNDTVSQLPPTNIPGFVNQTTIPGACPQSFTIIRLFRNTISLLPPLFLECIQRIEVQDNVPPENSPYQSVVHITCSDPIPPVPNITWHDNCDQHPVVNFCTERQNGSCPNEFFIVRTWTATDACGNSKCITQTIAAIDVTAPLLHNVPSNKIYECVIGLVIPSPPQVTATDSGCHIGSPNYTQTTRPGDCPGTYELVRRWTITDLCGNSAAATQVIAVVDTKPPIFTVPSGNFSFLCNQEITPPVVTAWDACAGPVPVMVQVIRHNTTNCENNYVLQFLYTAMDSCGNMNTTSIFAQVTNPTPPSFVPPLPPTSVTYQCGYVPPPLNLTATSPCGPAVVTFIETRYPTDCPNEYTLNRTWVATDICNLTTVLTEIIKVIDTIPPVLNNITAPGPFECPSQVPSLASMIPLITQAASPAPPCPKTIHVNATEVRLNGTCVNEFRLVRTFTATDCSGNTASITVTIYVKDVTPPILYNVPNNITAFCYSIPPPPEVLTSDNCDCPIVTAPAPGIDFVLIPNCVPVIYNQTRIDGSCPAQYTLKRTWTAIDQCGNTVTATRYVFVIDVCAPLFHDVPANTTVSCDAVPPPGLPTANSLCTNVTVTPLPEVRHNGSCLNDYELIRSWLATDECGNTATVAQSILVHDHTPPHFNSTPPASINVSCDAIPVPPPICAYDNCADLVLSFDETVIPGPCIDNVLFKLIRTWTATDACGNTAQFVQTVLVINNFVPIIPIVDSTTQECSNVFVPNTPNVTSVCTVVSPTSETTTIPGSCAQQFVLQTIIAAIDVCGNAANISFNVTVVDTIPPSFVNFPPNTSSECFRPSTPNVTATDLCDASPIVTGPIESVIAGSCPYDYVLVRTWTACDHCGNCVSQSQYIQIYSNTPPHFTTPLPQNESRICSPSDPPTLQAIDNCGFPANVTLVETNNNDTCPLIIKRTYIATDVCGHSTSYTYYVIVNDEIFPTFSDIDQVVIYNCSALPPPPVCGEDNCPGLVIEYEETKTNETCPYSYILHRRWTLDDACDNIQFLTQLVQVIDNTPPYFNRGPLNITVPCVPPPLAVPTATDNCDPEPNVTSTSYRVPETGACYTLYIVWRAEDACGNFVLMTDTITISDTIAPTVTFTPPLLNLSVDCADVPQFPNVSLSDNCPNAHFDVLPPHYEPGNCPYRFTLTRGVRAVDGCGNSNSYIQVITGVHTAAPTISGCPINVVTPCKTVIPLANVTAHDSCGVALVPSFSTKIINGSCVSNYTEQRNWTFIDVCGVVSSCVQNITYYDNVPPVLVGSPPQTLYDRCHLPAPPSPPAVGDACSPPVTVTVSTINSTGNCSRNWNQTVIITAVDSCANSASSVQLITSIATIPPLIYHVPGSVKVSCELVPPVPTNVTAYDYCGNAISVSFKQTRTNGSCPNMYNLTRVWTAVDTCGLSAHATQIIQVVDTTPPLITGVPADQRVLCGFVPCAANVSAADNCPGVTLHFHEYVYPGRTCCDFVIKRVWTATDACGNVATASQNITSYFNVPPVLIVPPNPPCINCEDFNGTLPYANVTAYRPPLASGYCVNSIISADVGCGTPNPLDDAIIFTLNAINYNLIFDPSSTVIVYVDGEARLVANLLDSNSNPWKLEINLNGQAYLQNLTGYTPNLELTPSCYGNGSGQVDPSSWKFFTQLSGSLSGNGNVISLTASLHPSQFGAGANGRNRQYGATIYVIIGGIEVPIRLDVRPDGEDCFFDPAFFPKLDCNIPLPINVTVVELPSRCPQEHIFNRTFCVTDYLDNIPITVCHSQIIRTCDNKAPQLTVPPCTEIECDETIPAAGGSAVDNCDTNVTLNVAETRVNGSCPFNYTLVRTYTATDDCGNSNSSVSLVKVRDTTPPVISGIPNATYTYFCYLPLLPPINATDNCGIDYTQWPRIISMRINGSIPGYPVCPQNYRQRYTITAKDRCNNRATSTFDVIIVNNRPPRLYGVPQSTIIKCNETIPEYTITANSTCEGDLTDRIVLKTYTSPVLCGSYIITNIWTVTDSCNQTDHRTQIITVINPYGPVFNQPLPTNITVPCNAIPPVANVTGYSPCGNFTINFHTSNSSGPCANNYTITRTWILTDCFFRHVVHTQYITVIDTTPPTITPVPPAINATCDTFVPYPPICAADECPGLELFFDEVRIPLSTLPGCDRFQLNRTWTAIDACGNSNSTNQIVTVFDNTPPTCTPPELPDVIDCTTVLVVPDPVCTDDCSNVTITSSSVNLPGPLDCPQSTIIAITWVAKDACGNTLTLHHNITVNISTAPVLHNVPDNATLECSAPPPIITINATDACFPELSPISSVQTVPTNCPLVRTDYYTYTVINPCGLAAVPAVFSVTYVDTTAPTFDLPLPEDITVECDGIPGVANVTATDNCGPATVVYSQTNSSGSCANSYILYRTWTAYDCSGNNSTFTQTITVVDTTPPVLNGTFSNITVDCKNVPLPPPVCGTDNCPGADLYFEEINQHLANNANCSLYRLVRRWTLIDACGNTDELVQTVVVTDSTAPSCMPPPSPINIECNTEYPNWVPSCTDDCSGVVASPIFSTTQGSCPANYVLHLDYIVSDYCGNFIRLNRTVRVADTKPPSFYNLPPNITVPCNDIPLVTPPTVNDTCSDFTVYFETRNTSVPGGCENFTIYRIWTAVDACGNSASVQQVIHVIQTQYPTFDSPLPENVTLDCTDTYVLPNVTASDVCGSVHVYLDVQQILYNGCTRVLRYTWSAVNNCGYTIYHSIYVVITDSVLPILSSPENFQPNVTIPCNATYNPPSICCSDNCPGPVLSFDETRVVNPLCPSEYKLLRQWRCVDTCGNVATLNQTVNVVDTFPPVFDDVPDDLEFECYDTSVPAVLTASSECSTVNVTRYDTVDHGDCPANFTITRHYVARDQCGKETTFNQTITVHDTIPPFTNETTPLCFYSYTALDYLVIRNLTVPNVFFPAGDLCSTIIIQFVNCSSDQDTIMGPGCFYNSTTDELFVSPNVSQSNPEGRLYTVYALIIDACGHTTLTSRVIFVPLNRESITIRDLPFNPEECVPVRVPCPRECDCQTVNHYCTSGNLNATLELSGSVYDQTTDTTTFTFQLVLGGSELPNRVILGIDLTIYELVSVSPSNDVTYGPQPNSFVQGIAWNNISGLVYSVTIKGHITTQEADESVVPYQLGGAVGVNESICTRVLLTHGPGNTLEPVYDNDSTNDVLGRVSITGFRFADDQSAGIFLQDVLVALINNSTGEILRLVLSNQKGVYRMHDVPSNPSLRLQLLPGGLLAPVLRSSGTFLRVNKYDIYGEDNIYGPPHLLSDRLFHLLIDETQTPVYNRLLSFNNFEGDSRPLEYWQYTVAHLGEVDPLYGGVLQSIITAVDSLLGCNVDVNSSDPFEANLAAAAFNTAVGRGFFDPYKDLQMWVLLEAKYLFCQNIQDPNARDIATNFLIRINTATDVDATLGPI